MSTDPVADAQKPTGSLGDCDHIEEHERVRRLLGMIDHERDRDECEQDADGRHRSVAQRSLGEQVLHEQVAHQRREQNRLGDRMRFHVMSGDVVDREEQCRREDADPGRLDLLGDRPDTQRYEHEK